MGGAPHTYGYDPITMGAQPQTYGCSYVPITPPHPHSYVPVAVGVPPHSYDHVPITNGEPTQAYNCGYIPVTMGTPPHACYYGPYGYAPVTIGEQPKVCGYAWESEIRSSRTPVESQIQPLQSRIQEEIDSRIELWKENLMQSLQKIVVTEFQAAMDRFQFAAASNVPPSGNSQILDSIHSVQALAPHEIQSALPPQPTSTKPPTPPLPSLQHNAVPSSATSSVCKNSPNDTTIPYPQPIINPNPNQTSTHFPPQSPLQTLNMWLQHSCPEIAHQVFDRMLKGDLVLFNSNLHGYLKFGLIHLANEMFNDTSMMLNLFYWNLVISGYTKLEFGFKIAWDFFNEMPKGELVHWNMIIGNLLVCGLLCVNIIFMYPKCDNIANAIGIFEEKNVDHCEVRVYCLMVHGVRELAFEFTMRIEKLLVKQDGMTVIVVTNVCGHELMREGVINLEFMRRIEKLEPKAQQNGCIVREASRGVTIEANGMIGRDFILKMQLGWNQRSLKITFPNAKLEGKLVVMGDGL